MSTLHSPLVCFVSPAPAPAVSRVGAGSAGPGVPGGDWPLSSLATQTGPGLLTRNYFKEKFKSDEDLLQLNTLPLTDSSKF